MVSDMMLGITLAYGMVYLFLWNAPVRWKRLFGGLGIFVLGLSLSTVSDNIPLFVTMMFSLLVGGIKIGEELWGLFS